MVPSVIDSKNSLSRECLAGTVPLCLKKKISLELGVENSCASKVATAIALKLAETNLEQETWLKLSG